MIKKLICAFLCITVAAASSPVIFASAESETASETGLTRGMEATFDYPILSDPYQMSDEEVFGVWNESEQNWSVEPKFAYSKWENMSAVENAAKSGDYAAAKEALLDYYRTYCSDRINPVYTYPGTDSYTRSMALARNFYGTTFGSNAVKGLFELDNEMKERAVDVTSSIADAIGSEQYRTFVLASIDQDSVAEFVTKEGGYESKLVVNVNGIIREVYVDADSYISAGTNSGNMYGSEPTMLASEGVTAEYVNSDENTKRCYLRFSLADFASTDTINSATLYVKGRNMSGTGLKEMLLYQWADSNFDEDTLNWNTFTEKYMFSCNGMDCWDYVTSNNTQIKGKSCFFHRGSELSVPATMYAYTGEEAYAHTFIRQEMGLIHSIGYNPNVMNQLDLTTHVGNTLDAVFRVMNSKYMSAESFTAIFKHFWLITRWICEEYYGQRNNNYATFATLAGYGFISYFREITDYDKWLLNTQSENERVNNAFVRPDGTNVELARGYQKTLLDTLVTPLKRQKTTHNSDSPYTDVTISMIRTLAHDFVYSASPGWRGFNFGDGNDAFTNNNSTIQFFYTDLFPDDEVLAYALTDGKEGSLPSPASMVFPYGLRTYMRSGWDNKAYSLAFTAKGEKDSSHGDSDLLSISMFAHGQYLIIDPGYGSVLTGGRHIYMGSAQQHSTVTANGDDHINDGQGRAGTEGTQEEAEINNVFDFVTYSADDAIIVADKFRRSVTFVKDAGFWIVSDYIAQDGSAYNDYSQQWHMLPDANISIDDDTKIAHSNYSGVNVKVVPVSPEDYTYVQLEDTTYSPKTGSFIANLKACYHQKTNAPEVVYTTLLVPENLDENISVKAQKLDTGLSDTAANSAYIEVTDSAKNTSRRFYYYHLNDNANQQTVTLGKYKTDATTLVIEETTDGKLMSAMLLNGTFLMSDELTDGYVYKNNNKLDAIVIRSNGECIDIDGEKITSADLNEATFYNFGTYKNVYVKGDYLTVKNSNGYLYFGDSPIVVGTPVTPGGNTGGGGTGGGSGGGSGGSALPPSQHGGGSGGTTAAEPQQPEKDPDEAIKQELSGHWAEKEIYSLYKAGIVTGGDGGLRLKANISRAEFVALIARVLGINSNVSDGSLYSDVNGSDWFCPYITAVSQTGIVSGSDGMFRPNDCITRQEMCKILVNALEYKTGKSVAAAETDFSDKAEISGWASEFVKKAYAAGLVKGMDDGRFAPSDNTLRDQAFVVISRLLDAFEN